MELVKCTNVGLKLGGTNLTIPCIRAVIKDYAGSHTASEMNTLVSSIAQHAIGMTALCSYFTSKSADFISGFNLNTTYTLGDNSGFKVVFNCTGDGNRWRDYAYSTGYVQTGGGLFYKGYKYNVLSNATGYTDYEYSFAFILTDEDYNLIRTTDYTSSTCFGGINYRANTSWGATAFNNNVICPLTGNGTYYNQQGAKTLQSGDNIRSLISGEIDPTITDPYAPAGESGPDGGDGDFDFTSTDIPLPGLPSIGAMSTGFLNMYNPSAAQLRALASYMWSGAFDPQNFKKLFADPMDAILGLHIIPTISGHPATTSSSLYVGNIDTGLSMPAVTEQYYSLDCGTVNIPAKWGAYLDYSPYSKLSLYLPYIGVVPLSADDCMRGSIQVKYNIDILSGTCSVSVYCVSNRGRDGHTLYTFTGSCSCECPITEGQYANVIMAGLNVVSGIISGASGGVPGMVAGGVAQAANAAISMVKPEIGRSGSMGGSAGLMGIQYPFLILTVPRMAIPGQQNTYIGYPSFVTMEMSECSGYTEINVTHLTNMTCTDGEADEIIRLLEKGVIF